MPASPWLDKEAPAAPVVTVSEQNGQHQISWSHSNEGDVFQWVLYYRYGNNWSYKILNYTDRNTVLPTTTGAGNNQSKLNTVIVSAVDRTGNESVKTEIIIK